MAKRSRKSDVRAKLDAALARVEFKRGAPPISAEELNQLVGFFCQFNLQPDHLAFMEKQNGGDPHPGIFKWHHPQKGKQESRVYSMFGLDPRSPADISRGADCISWTLNLRDELPRSSYVIGYADRDDPLLSFEHGPREGQIWIKHWDEVSPLVEKPSTPEDGLYFVAGSFTDFLGLLYRSDDDLSPAAIALDSKRLRGRSLKAILEKLGCTPESYDFVEYSATKLPPMWHWTKYRSMVRGLKASLKVEKNKTFGYAPKFDQRDVGHPILCVSVHPRDQAKCIGELMAALGNGAVLLKEVR